MEKLSSDLLVRCFLYLPLRDLLAVCSTCRRIKAVGEDSRLWVNLMERLCGSAYRQPHAGPVVLVRNNAKLTFVAMYSAERAQSLVYQAPCSSPQFVDTSCPRPDSNNRRSVFITASPKLSRTTSQERRLLLVHSRGDLSDPEPTVSQDIGSKNLSMSPSVPPGSSPKSPTAIVSLMPPPSTPPPIPPSIVTPPPLLPRSKVPFEEPLKTSVSSMEIPASGHSQIFQLMLPPSEPPPVPSPIRTGSPPTAPPSKRAQTETTNMIIPPPPKNPPPIPSILKEGADGKTRDRESKHKKDDKSTKAKKRKIPDDKSKVKPSKNKEIYWTNTDELPEYSFSHILTTPLCKEIKAVVEMFIRTFEKRTKRLPLDDESKILNDFLASAEYTMKIKPPWCTMPSNEFVKAKASMKRYVFGHLYNCIFFKRAFQEKDNKFQQQVARLKPVVTLSTMEIKIPIDASLIRSSIEELEAMDKVYTPYEKIACILKACKVVIYALQTSGSSAGADDFLPLFIYIVIQANLSRVISNTSFVSRFADMEERIGEGFCFYTHLVSACLYIETMDPSDLNVVSPDPESSSLRDNGTSVPTPTVPSKSWQAARRRPSPQMPSNATPSAEVSPVSESSMSVQGSSPLATEEALPFEMDDGELKSSSPNTITRTSSSPKIHHFIGTQRKISVDILSGLSSSTLPVEQMVCSIASVGTGEIWVGLSTGEILIYRDTSDFSCSVTIHKTPIFCMTMVGHSVLCSSENSELYDVDILSHTISKRDCSFLGTKVSSRIQIIMPVHIENSTDAKALVVSVTSSTSHAVLLSGDSASKDTIKTQIDGIATCATQHCNELWIGTSSGLIIVFDAHNLTLVRVIRLQSESVTSMANVWSESFILVAQGSSLISLDINTGVAVQCFERLGEPHTPTAVISSGTTTQGSVGSIKTGPAQQTNSIVAVRTLSDFVIALQQDGKLLVWNRKDPKCLQVLTPNRPAVQPPNTETVLTHPDLSSTAPTTTNQLQSPPTTQTPTPTPTNPNSHRNRPLHTFVVAETAGLVCTNPVTIWASVGEGSTTLLIWQ